MTKFSAVFLFASALLVLSGCASLSEGECRSGNWYQLGYSDGSAGQSSNRVLAHEESCSEYRINIDREEYEKGRYSGLTRNYCTQRKGYELGSRLTDYSGICPAEFEQPLIDGYADGLEEQLRIAQDRFDAIAYDLRDLESRIARTDDPVTRDQLKLELDDLDHAYEDASDRLDKITYLLRKHRL